MVEIMAPSSSPATKQQRSPPLRTSSSKKKSSSSSNNKNNNCKNNKERMVFMITFVMAMFLPIYFHLNADTLQLLGNNDSDDYGGNNGIVGGKNNRNNNLPTTKASLLKMKKKDFVMASNQKFREVRKKKEKNQINDDKKKKKQLEPPAITKPQRKDNNVEVINNNNNKTPVSRKIVESQKTKAAKTAANANANKAIIKEDEKSAAAAAAVVGKQQQQQQQQQTEKNEKEVVKTNTAKAAVSTNNNNNPPPHPATEDQKLYMTYSRFEGRLNNQWFNLVAALLMSTRFNRTLLVPPELRVYFDITKMFDYESQYWNIDYLHGNYSLIYIENENDQRLNITDPSCNADYRKDLAWKPLNQAIDKFKHCPVVDMGGKYGLLFCQRHRFCIDDRVAYDIYSKFRPGPIVERYIKNAIGTKHYKYAVHSRTIGGSGVDAGNSELCSPMVDRVAKEHFEPNYDYSKFDLPGHCFLNNTLKDVLHNQDFLLASDGSLDWKTNYGNHAIIVSDLALSKEELGRKGKESGLLASLIELWSLIDADYFYGNVFSTFSLSVCILRGEHRKYNSNVCWILLHPDTKYAVLPPEEPPQPEQEEVKTINHAFVRSTDSNFVVIDRYIVETPKTTKKRIAILADGIAPLIFHEDEDSPEKNKEKWAVSTNFTCSMGSQKNTKTSVVLMDGKDSPKTHYLLRRAFPTDTWTFSGNNDKFRTIIIYCDEIEYDETTIGQAPPLILSSSDGTFKVTVDTTFVIPSHMTNNNAPPQQQTQLLTAVHCVCPLYGLKDPHWLIEYIEYHLAAGVSHLHIYDWDFHKTPPTVKQVYEEYQRLGLVSYHDWSLESSKGYLNVQTYERGKWAAQTDCLLRSRGSYDYALYSDVDEVWLGDTTTTTTIDSKNQQQQVYPPGHIGSGLAACQKAREESNGVVIGCGVHSHTVTSIYTIFTPEEQKRTLLLQRYDREEAYPSDPGNMQCRRWETDPTTGKKFCAAMYRMYHNGRCKLIVNVRDLSIEARPIFTHGVSRDYTALERIQYQLPDDKLHIRHYQGHWFIHQGKLDESLEQKDAPIPDNLLKTMRDNIQKSKVIGPIYNSTIATGIHWIKPVFDRSNKVNASSKN